MRDELRFSSEYNDQMHERYMIFQLGKETYATPLITVREVVECQTPKQVPLMPPYFLGVINVRGLVVGVVDLRIRLGMPAEFQQSATCMLIFETPAGTIAAVVDKVLAVDRLQEQVEAKQAVAGTFPLDAMTGVAHWRGQLVTRLDVSTQLTSDLAQETEYRKHLAPDRTGTEVHV